MELDYPYHAAPEREQTILAGVSMVQPGMQVDEVKDILGEPDEVHDLYEPNKTASRPVGFTYWYIIQRLKASGRLDERGEQSVRVTFGDEGAVVSVDQL